MESLVEQGLVRSIGVSNFNSEQIKLILDNCKIKPAVNQVRNDIETEPNYYVKFMAYMYFW